MVGARPAGPDVDVVVEEAFAERAVVEVLSTAAGAGATEPVTAVIVAVRLFSEGLAISRTWSPKPPEAAVPAAQYQVDAKVGSGRAAGMAIPACTWSRSDELDPSERGGVESLMSRLDAVDLAEREPRDVVGAALSMRTLAARRQPGETRVSVFTPTLSEHGWTSRRTIVDICTADAPFLVDSVTAAIARQGLAVHLLLHPLVSVRRGDDGELLETEVHGGELESWIHLEVDRVPNDDGRAALTERLLAVLADVHAAVADWPAMRRACLSRRWAKCFCRGKSWQGPRSPGTPEWPPKSRCCERRRIRSCRKYRGWYARCKFRTTSLMSSAKMPARRPLQTMRNRNRRLPEHLGIWFR